MPKFKPRPFFLLNYPPILECLLSHCDNATLAMLQRTCSYLFSRAGRLLYEDITIRDELHPVIFRGAHFPSVSNPAIINNKNAMLRYTRKATFALAGKHQDGIRRGLKDEDQIALPALDVWTVIDPVDRFLTPLDWGVKIGHSTRHLVWKGIHGEALTNQLAGAKATARIMGARSVTMVMDGPCSKPASANILYWEKENGSTLPCPLERITIVTALPTIHGRMGKHYLKQTVAGVYDFIAIILAVVRCHTLPVEVVGLECGDDDGDGSDDADSAMDVDMLCGGAGSIDPGNWRVWDKLLLRARSELLPDEMARLMLTTLSDWLRTREAGDIYRERELCEMAEIALAAQPKPAGEEDDEDEEL
jgi:hypothetical protein